MKNSKEEKDIFSLLEKKLALFKQYLTITKKMKKAIEDKKPLDIGSLISKREDCIKRIESIDRSIKKVINKNSDKLSSVSGKLRALTESYTTSIRKIMETVKLMDRDLMAMVKEQGDSIKTELLKMRNNRQAVHGYKNQIGFSPRFLDTTR